MTPYIFTDQYGKCIEMRYFDMGGDAQEHRQLLQLKQNDGVFVIAWCCLGGQPHNPEIIEARQ